MKNTFRFTISVLALAVVASGIAAFATETDDRIESSFKKTYVYRTFLKSEHVSIESKNGAVVLSGTVDSSRDSAMAEDTAESLPGVKSVQNRVKVTGTEPTAMSDSWIGMKVKSSLAYYRNVDATKTDVSVKNGAVMLTGEADTQAQKELTTEYARDVEGVKSVQNDMTVAKMPHTMDKMATEDIDDASITAQVRASLLSHRSTGGMKTRITTNDGVVTVSGTVANTTEKDLITKRAENVYGVKSVVNNMTVVPAVS